MSSPSGMCYSRGWDTSFLLPWPPVSGWKLQNVSCGSGKISQGKSLMLRIICFNQIITSFQRFSICVAYILAICPFVKFNYQVEFFFYINIYQNNDVILLYNVLLFNPFGFIFWFGMLGFPIYIAYTYFILKVPTLHKITEYCCITLLDSLNDLSSCVCTQKLVQKLQLSSKYCKSVNEIYVSITAKFIALGNIRKYPDPIYLFRDCWWA